MTGPRMRFPRAFAALLALVVAGGQASAQGNPATIPTVVAQAAGWPRMMGGTSQFFDARLPDGFPASLVPPGAKVIGGSIVGDSSMFIMRTAVLEVAGEADAGEVLLAVLTRAGFAEFRPGLPDSRGGFVATNAGGGGTMYCSDSTMAVIDAVHPIAAPRVWSLALIGGEAGRQSCGPGRTQNVRSGFPVDLPPLAPPAGVAQIDGGSSSWGGEGGSISTSLRATMPADSVLAHYTAQLVDAGWKAEGRAVVSDAIGVQRFTFRHEDQDWVAGLFVLGTGDRQQIRLDFARRDQ